MAYTLGTAAKAVGISKATMHRAIKSGKISAARHDDGSYTIDPAELHRVFPPVSFETVSSGVSEFEVRQSVTPLERVETRETPDISIRNAGLEAELTGVRELLRVREEQIESLTRSHRDQIDDLRVERDKLLSQMDATQRLLTHQMQTSSSIERRPWWKRLVG
jgi:predicted site-specific integrase-resolvase